MKEVTERDFRMPEFYDANPCDYEFRSDGKIVRKDRWEKGIRTIASRLGFNARDGFEIDEIVDKVTTLYSEPVCINENLIRCLRWALNTIKANPEINYDNDYYESAIEALEKAENK